MTGTRRAAAELAAAAAVKDRRWVSLSQQLTVVAGQGTTTSGSQSSCAVALSRVTGTPGCIWTPVPWSWRCCAYRQASQPAAG